ncbi:MAG: glycosyltransferase family 2 protein, partial [Minisyncoccia bacterium]
MNKTEKPFVSIILPTYNRSHLLERSIKSVLEQSYQNFELIIINDGSNDETEEKVKEYQKLDRRIKYLKNKKNLGLSVARNIGIQLSKGEFIGFQDDDDFWLKRKLEKQVRVLNSLPESFALVFTAWYRWENKKKIYFPQKKYDLKNIQKLLLSQGYSMPTPSMLIKKSALFETGFFDEKLKMLEDLELAIRLSDRYFFQFIEEPLFIYFSTPRSLSSQRGKIYLETKKYIFEKHFEKIKKDKKILARWLNELGHLFILENENK